jgi:hypothetical protein
MGMVYSTLYEWLGARPSDLVKAEEASRRAEALTPEFAEAHVARAFALSLSGHYADAAAISNKLSGATPISSKRIITSPVVLSPMATCFFPRSSFKWRRIAVRRTCKARRFSPNPRACCGETKRRGSACQTIIRAERCLLLKPCDARAPALGSLALFDDGQTTRAMEWSKRSFELYPEDMGTLIQAACLHFRMGVKEEALRLPERVFSHGWANAIGSNTIRTTTYYATILVSKRSFHD